MENKIYAANTPLTFNKEEVKGTYVRIDGEKFYKISHYDKMPPFFMSLVSADDHWLFVSSRGGLSAGRKNPDNALFPYYTVDKIHDSSDFTGSKTIMRVAQNEKEYLWEPFSDKYIGLYSLERNLYKNIPGNKLIFEEVNHNLNLRFSYAWKTSAKYGFVRKASIKHLGTEKTSIALLDGIQNIMPSGIDSDFQNSLSVLADAYKRNELLPAEGIALYYLNSVPTDKAEPAEGLKATAVWSHGLPNALYLLSSEGQDVFRKGKTLRQETDLRGTRAAYFLQSDFTLTAADEKCWYIVAEINQDITDLVHLRLWLQNTDNPAKAIDEDVQAGTQLLRRYVADADGIQKSADDLGAARHFANVLFNIMRGGIVNAPKGLPTEDFKDFLKNANLSLYEKHKALLMSLPKFLSLSNLKDFAKNTQDKHLIRIAGSYLPLIFSRRHGDPSRPWNYFSVNLKNDNGTLKYYYEGNWRDLFQNWEALAFSFPEYAENMIAQFLNASTVDGYNPYRVSSNGIDWEVPEPDNPWSNIGYWGDHQIVYLHKLLEISANYHPQALKELLTQDIYVFANVPYHIKSYHEICQDPYDTILFDSEADAEIKRKEKTMGADAKLLTDKSGQIVYVNLVEKLLLTALVKLSNFVPDGGIWLNTQRPEWNDANNALVGKGASVVTVYQLRPYLRLLRNLIKSSTLNSLKISISLKHLLYEMYRVLESHADYLSEGFDAKSRKSLTDRLGLAGSEYRATVYAGKTGKKWDVPVKALIDFIELSLRYTEQTIRSNKRPDNLYQSYNLLRFDFDKNELHIDYLYEMLEGQAAVLASGALSPAESLSVLDALKNSALFRADQYSYILYPDKDLPGFMQKNTIRKETAENSELVQTLVRSGNKQIITKDALGDYHFNGEIRNADDLNIRLDELVEKSDFEELVSEERKLMTDEWEAVFNHKAFTGRSGTFFGYEGLGSIYWHMVSKLLQAVGQTYVCALQRNAEPDILAGLVEHYYEIRAGIGMNKSPEVYGAFPSDPYSHTPAGAGAKQPGMTGQVKEDIISRFTEVGVQVKDGKLSFNGGLLRKSEFLKQKDIFRYFSVDGQERSMDLSPGSLAFTVCSVPVVYRLAEEQKLKVVASDNNLRESDNLQLTSEESQSLFMRTGDIQRLEVHIRAELE